MQETVSGPSDMRSDGPGRLDLSYCETYKRQLDEETKCGSLDLGSDGPRWGLDLSCWRPPEGAQVEETKCEPFDLQSDGPGSPGSTCGKCVQAVKGGDEVRAVGSEIGRWRWGHQRAQGKSGRCGGFWINGYNDSFWGSRKSS